MEKRKPFGDLTNLSLSGSFVYSSHNVKPRAESPPLAESSELKQGGDLKVPDEKKEDFTVTKPRQPDLIKVKTEVGLGEEIDQEQHQESSNQEMTEVSPAKERRERTRPADLVLCQQTSSLHSLDPEELEVSGWESPSPSLHSQYLADFLVVQNLGLSPPVFSVLSSPLYSPTPGFQVMSPLSPLMTSLSFPSLSLSPCLSVPQSQADQLFATLLPPGYVRLCLGRGVFLDVSNDFSLRLTNPLMESSITVCGQSQRAAIIHPSGRALVYSPRLEVQVKDQVSVKTAKMFPRDRVSFTADNCALVYSLDSGGPRSTTEVFHDLEDNIVDTMFQDSCLGQNPSVDVSREQMYEAQYWSTPVSFKSPISPLYRFS